MNSAKRLLGVIFVGLASTALFIACGESADSCLTDTDCQTGFVCEDELCIQECVTAADCPAFDECVPRPSGSAGSICVEGEAPATNNNTTTDPNNTIPGEDPLYVVMIRDTTTGAAGCEISDPGSDLASVGLETFGGDVLGYFAAEFFEAGDEPNGNDYPDILINLDGDAPSFGLACPESFAAENVSALGCGGYVIGNFLDDAGTPVILDSSAAQVRVVEYGPNCAGSADDSLEVVLCTDTAAALSGNIASCTDVIGSGSGDVIGVL
ncbi:hypothetical protein FRD01_20885 [Microvenator marinus]|jgi:hypothetical protein|uniref:Uncharacterized protein n=1 Tax=Microvenator marinus TaxID=2600177 RepID=A0A5B8XWW5_9DELT|nr:hypothetical protein [Microvenator marinus]QED29647.1 hypothetical protein FRD01_20885 [Microvenator marinus]